VLATIKRSLILVPVLWSVTALRAAEPDDGWSNLKRVTRDRGYTVLLRDYHCVQGQLKQFSSDALVIQLGSSGQEVVIQRSQVLRVADGGFSKPRDLVFSGRSSWSDVRTLKLTGSEYLSVRTKGGKDFRIGKPEVLEESMTGGGRSIEKAEVRSAYYVRFTPLTDTEVYLAQEMAEFAAPRLWFNGVFLEKIPVRLYDSSIQEDNTPLESAEKACWASLRPSFAQH
jgi:hypothetical protein